MTARTMPLTPRGAASLLPHCVCGSKSVAHGEKLGVPTMLCTDCGVVRQYVPFTAERLAEWYATEYLQQKYTHTYEHDVDVARTRLDAYSISTGARVLDIGAGNGAFVNEARARGLDAWGQDLSEKSESAHVYVGALHDVAFPADSFDVITMHDVLEHVVDPLEFLREARRVLRRPGKLIVDFPNFHVTEGKHHWKKIEHLWMFTVSQLIDVLEGAGFEEPTISYPIPSKVVVTVSALPEKRAQILVPPGIGDSYWSMVKIPGYLRENNLNPIADVWVQDAGGPKRTIPFLRNLANAHAVGYREMGNGDPIFHEAYMKDARTVFPNPKEGIDAFIAYNGVMRYGKSLEDVDPEYGVEWFPRFHVSKEALEMRDRLVGTCGRYALCYFVEAGMYRYWLADFPVSRIRETLHFASRELEMVITLSGAKWDRGQVGGELVRSEPKWLDLIGATTFDQLVGAILGASVVVGFPAGNTILATMLQRPTVLLWHKYFDSRFWTNACPPNTPYIALDISKATMHDITQAMMDVMLRGGTIC